MYQTAIEVRITLQIVLISSVTTISFLEESLLSEAIRKETDIIAFGNVMSRSRMSWLKLFTGIELLDLGISNGIRKGNELVDDYTDVGLC